MGPRFSLALIVALSPLVLGDAACYSTGDGTLPPGKSFYFPVGLAVSTGGNVLYAANSDFDLQWNGGTLQSYDLHLIRKHTVLAIANPNDPALPLVRGRTSAPGSGDPGPSTAPTTQPGAPQYVQPLGQTCAPPVDSTFYVRDSAVIGAFATDLQLAVKELDDHSHTFTRLFMPVRGNASLTWADVTPEDDPSRAPPEDATPDTYAPFRVDCGARVNAHCDQVHQSGTDANEPGNTRHLTMPGEPFGMAQSQAVDAIVVTHQTDTKTSLFSTGLSGTAPPAPPALEFILEGLPTGGNGVSAIPHDPRAFTAQTPPRPAFLQTSRNVAELDLIRFYSDQGKQGSSSLYRPFLIKEAAFQLAANAGGTDSRGIAIDPTPRIRCKAAVDPNAPDAMAQKALCAQRPARVFFANRTPASMILGEVGEPSLTGDGTFDSDRLVIFGNVPLTFGPSRVYLAPIVDQNGNYALRVFIVCFDSATLFIYDPDAGAIENVIHLAPGPYALAFDPFTCPADRCEDPLEDVALGRAVGPDPREPGLDLKRYRFAYVASFTDSYVQVIDLDGSRSDKSTFETVVFSLGAPTLPKGTQ